MEQSKPTHVLVRALFHEDRGVKPPPADAVTPEFYNGLVQRRLGELAKPLPPKQLDELAARLHRYVTELEKGGTKVVFFEVPEIPESWNQPLKVSIRERVRSQFPEPQYRWVPFVDAGGYKSSDAVHLTRNGAAQYCGVLASFMHSIDPVVAPLTTPTAPPGTSPVLAGPARPPTTLPAPASRAATE